MTRVPTLDDRDGRSGRQAGVRSRASRQLAVLGTTTAFAALGFLGAGMMPPSFKAEAEIAIEMRLPPDLLGEDAATDATIAAALHRQSLNAQIASLTSNETLASVAARLRVPDRADFASLASRLFETVPSEDGVDQATAVVALRETLVVRRIPNTDRLTIGFSSRDPVLARDVPNAIVAEYSRQRTQWLQATDDAETNLRDEEAAVLHDAIRVAEAKLAGYRARLVAGGEGSAVKWSGDGAEAANLVEARAARVAAETRLQATIERQSATRAQIAKLSTTLLDNHPRLKSLRSQSRELDAEVAKLGSDARAGLEVEALAALGTDATRASVVATRVATDAGFYTELRALEREVATRRERLETHLALPVAPTSSAGQLPPANVRLVSPALLPTVPAAPNVWLITVIGGALGLILSGLGLLIAKLRNGRPGELNIPSDGSSADEVGAAASPIDLDRISEAATPVEIASAIERAGVGRVVVTGSETETAAIGAVELSRCLAARGRATVLVDFTTAASAAKAMGLLSQTIDVVSLAASPTAFANAIHRDRASGAHVLAAVLDEGRLPSGAVDVVLEALGEAYDHVTVVAEPNQSEAIANVEGRATAVVFADASGDGNSLDPNVTPPADAVAMRVVAPVDRALAA